METRNDIQYCSAEKSFKGAFINMFAFMKIPNTSYQRLRPSANLKFAPCSCARRPRHLSTAPRKAYDEASSSAEKGKVSQPCRVLRISAARLPFRQSCHSCGRVSHKKARIYCATSDIQKSFGKEVMGNKARLATTIHDFTHNF